MTHNVTFVCRIALRNHLVAPFGDACDLLYGYAKALRKFSVQLSGNAKKGECSLTVYVSEVK
jgi:hypothetical protein